jgi:putative transposase
MGLCVEHRQHKGLNNRTENSHKATRTDHEAIQSARQAQRFLSVHDQIATSSTSLIPNPSHRLPPSSRERAFAAWRAISKTGATA